MPGDYREERNTMKREVMRWIRGALIGAAAVFLMGCGAGSTPVSDQAERDVPVQEQPESG